MSKFFKVFLLSATLTLLCVESLVLWRLTERVADLEWIQTPRDREWWSVAGEVVEPPPRRTHILLLERVEP